MRISAIRPQAAAKDVWRLPDRQWRAGPALMSADLQRRFGGLQRLYGVAECAQRIRAATWWSSVLASVPGPRKPWPVSGVGRLTLIIWIMWPSNINHPNYALTHHPRTSQGARQPSALRSSAEWVGA